jgi:uncharacterized protein
MTFGSFSGALSFLLWSTFAISIILGAVANKTNFCTMGSVSDMVNMNDFGRFRAWLLAIATAVIGVALLEHFGKVDVTGTFPPYRGGQLLIAENLIGGFLFGIGMTLGSGCANKTLVRIGGGNLKSIVVLIAMSIIAYYMTTPLPGSDQTLYSLLFYHWTNPLSIQLSGSQDIGSILSASNVDTMRLISGLVVGALLLVFIFRSAEFRSSRDNLLAGLVVGAVVLSGWYVSSNVSIDTQGDSYSLSGYYQEWPMLADSNEGKPAAGRTLSPQSYTFVNPVGQTFGYAKDGFKSKLLTFGLMSVFGVILGSFLWALVTRGFRVEWFVSFRDFITHLIGGLLMGFGGILGMGCTIGQGITGFSTLAVGSILTFLAIVFGAALTMKVQYYKLVYEDEASFFSALVASLADMKLLPGGLRKLEKV